MRIRSIHLKDFKRFTDLTIEGIPGTAKLVILVGPSGSGKSSLFDAINAWGKDQRSSHYDPEYYRKYAQPINSGSPERFSSLGVSINADDCPSNLGEACYIRSAYRHTPKFSISTMQTIDESQYWRHDGQRNFSTPDDEVQKNYQRIYGRLVKAVLSPKVLTNVVIREEVLGQVHDSLQSIFPDLSLHSLEDPEGKGTFYFERGEVKKYNYVNLSGGEKAAFDLLLDFVVRREYYSNAAMCIDEPEVHMGLNAQSKLLGVLYELIPEKSQLWLGTHSIGILRASKKILEADPDKVVFLDFSGHNFDQKVTIEPITNPDRNFWEKLHRSVLEDLSDLLAPEQIVICEGSHGDDGFDAECYNQIFSQEFSNTKFISAGGKRDLQNYIAVVGAVTKGAKVFGLRDRDQLSDREAIKIKKKGIKVLERGKIENYLLSDDVLCEVCQDYKLEPCEEKVAELIELRDNTTDIKNATNQIRRKIIDWGVNDAGETREGFLRDTVVPLIKPGMSTYDELKQIIFGSDDT